MKEYICKTLCAVAFLAFSLSQMKAQEAIVADTINVDELVTEKPSRVPLE